MNRDERPVSESSSEATHAQRPPRGRLSSNAVAVSDRVACKNSMSLRSLEGRKHYPLHDNLQQCT